MPLASNYANGTFYGERWFCGCGLEAPWLTSGKENSKGEKFARCPKPRDRQCEFFLTEVDDATARVEKSSDIPPAPRTPTGKQTGGMPQSLLTPETGTGSNTSFFGSSRGGYLQRPDDTPTPYRFRADENGDLPSLILSLLQNDSIVLKSSTKSAIRHVIGDRLAGYEAKLQNSAGSLELAFKKIDELEKGGGSAIS